MAIFKSRLIICIMLIIASSFLLIFPGCAKQPAEEFAIYLTKDDIPPAQMEIMSHVTLMDEPIITSTDIDVYNAQTHEIRLTAAAFERIMQLEVPVRGKSFLVCIDKQPVYWGAFWTPVSSMSFDGVTIWKPMRLQEPYIITLELGYPSSSFYGGEDPRNNTGVLDSLENAGKLIDKLTVFTVSKLPRSFKGYELYSWTDKGEWHFTLITGTNRNKFLDEIINEPDYISETGWINIHVTGDVQLKIALSKLPAGEEIFWLPELRAEGTDFNGLVFGYPPETELNGISEFAQQQGLKLSVIGR